MGTESLQSRQKLPENDSWLYNDERGQLLRTTTKRNDDFGVKEEVNVKSVISMCRTEYYMLRRDFSCLISCILFYEFTSPSAYMTLEHLMDCAPTLERLGFTCLKWLSTAPVAIPLQKLPLTHIKHLVLRVPLQKIINCTIFANLTTLTTNIILDLAAIQSSCTKLMDLKHEDTEWSRFPVLPECFIFHLQTFHCSSSPCYTADVFAFLKYALKHEKQIKWQECRIEAFTKVEKAMKGCTNPVLQALYDDYPPLKKRFDQMLACNRHIHRTVISRTLQEVANRAWPAFGNSIVNIIPNIWRLLRLY